MFGVPVDLFGLFAFFTFSFCIVLLVVFALHNKWSQSSSQALLFALMAFAGAASYSFLTQARLVVDQSLSVLETFLFLVMPFSFLYISKWPNEEWKRTDWIHFVPACLVFLFSAFVSLSFTDLGQQHALVRVSSKVIYYSRSLQWIVYCTAMLFTYRKLVVNVHQIMPRESKRFLIWINLFTAVIAVTSIIPFALNMQHILTTEVLFSALVNTAGFVLGMFLLTNPRVLYGWPIEGEASTTDFAVELQLPELQENPEGIQDINPEDVPQLKPKKISLSEEQIEYMHTRLHEFMFIRKPFLHQKYTLQQLSSESGFPLYQLSLYLNRTLGMNFNTYINKLRIEFLLESYKRNREKWSRYTLEAIAREIGFNNRTSFIQAFKKFTGSNPSVYFKNIHGHILND